MPKIYVRFQKVAPSNHLTCLCEHCEKSVAEGKVGMHVFIDDVSHILVDEIKECSSCNQPTTYFKFFIDLNEAARTQKEIADQIEREGNTGSFKLIPGKYEVVGAVRIRHGAN